MIAENQSLAFIVHHHFLVPIHNKNEKAKVAAAAAAVLSLSSRVLCAKCYNFQLLSARFYLCRVFCEMHKQRLFLKPYTLNKKTLVFFLSSEKRDSSLSRGGTPPET